MAIAYAALVGRYVSMERPSTEAEIAAGDPETSGGEGVVALVAVRPEGVHVVWDYGMGFVIKPDERWSITIWPDEETRKTFRNWR